MKRLRSPQVALVALAFAGLLLTALTAPAAPAPPQERDSLAAETPIGWVLEREGGALRKPVLARRWGVAERGEALEVGDWLEVAARGANALEVRLATGARLTLGPGSLVELVAADSLRLARGDAALDPRKGGELAVAGPGDQTFQVDTPTVLRARGRDLERLDEPPLWLSGYRANASTEALGSLLANVDGRNVPLTIGYHSVKVDIRDQIARTVIEESFVNHTSSVLEGVFYFPLPADASISGFGMWIGDELVQGDIVEKERARRIYETILRERRDPGLLEWTGGNLFKARVFPIGSEKRIRIAYTQVLPSRDGSYAYHYALQSELLRKTPLRRLEITVDVHSAEPLTSVECPSHPCRVRSTEHAARVEFSADEFAPERDFELRIAARPDAQGLTLVPHRRGDDGYFMLKVDAPAIDAGAPSDEPLDLLILTDTSASSWGPPRENLVACVESLIAALGEGDTFTLATCDVVTRWAFERPVPATHANRVRALGFLEARDPLGWSDLEETFAQACERAGPRTHVVYLGDGVPTSGAADPVALAHGLERSYRGQGTFHAVVPGPAREPLVLRALTALGGGSLREIGGGTDPAQTALALLEEIAAPALEEIEVSFEGLPVAAVYPETLPSLPAGRQAILVGRFEPPPSGGDLAGRVVVTGTLAGRSVRLERDVVLAAEDEGNSFIPRLWARHHLDHLLDQGDSERTRERIIALSEDFQIVTPHTSFLVLESDEDRKRFEVQRRFRMRDGEEFFAEGRERGDHELAREQILAAKQWRRELRENLLKALAGMGRDLTELLREDHPGSGPWGPLASSQSALGYIPASGGTRMAGDELFEREISADRQQAAPPEEEEFEEDFDDATEELGEPATARESVASRPTRWLTDGSGAAGDKRDRSKAGFFLPRKSQLHSLGYAGYHADPFDHLFPTPRGVRSEDPEWEWPEEVLEILSSLDRRAAISRSSLAWRFAVESESVDLRGRRQGSRGTSFVDPTRWLSLGSHPDGQAYAVEWLVGEERGRLDEGWRLGRVRAAQEGEQSSWPAPFGWYFGDTLRAYHSWHAELTDLDDGRARITLSNPQRSEQALILEIDVDRGLLLEQGWISDGERTHGSTFGAFEERGGLWWPGEERIWGTEIRGESSLRIEVEVLEGEAFTTRFDAELSRRENAILLEEEEVDLAPAKQAVVDGTAGFPEHWRLLRHFASTQRWERARPHLEALVQLVGERPGITPIRLVYLRESRRNEELRAELEQLVAGLAGAPREAEYGLALSLLGFTNVLNQGNEVLEILRLLRPVFERQEEILDATHRWHQRYLQAMAVLRQPQRLLEARLRAARELPYAVDLQTTYAAQLAREGEVDLALQWLESVRLENGPWRPYELQQLRSQVLYVLWEAYRLEEVVEQCEAWLADPLDTANLQLAARHLSALTYLGREREEQALLTDWLDLAGKRERKMHETELLQAAIQHALGRGFTFYRYRMSAERAELLARTARVLVDHDESSHMTSWIVRDARFRESDAGRVFLGQLLGELELTGETMPYRSLGLRLGWLHGFDATVDGSGDQVWRGIMERVFARWSAATDAAERDLLASNLRAYAQAELRLRFFRARLQEALRDEDAAARVAAAQELAAELRKQPWSAEIQQECTSLLAAMALGEEQDPDALSAEIDRRIVALYDLVNWILTARVESIVTELPGYESMTRRDLRKQRAQARRVARQGALELVTALEDGLEPAPLRDWARIERLFLEVEGGGDLDRAWTESLALLREQVAALGETEEPTQRDGILAQRAIATLTLLLVDGEESPAREADLRSALEELIEEEVTYPDGRASLANLLVALDRGDELAATLRGWYEGGRKLAKIRWGRDLAHLLAERGDLQRAASILEEIDRLDELEFEDFSALAGWYTALDQKERGDAALVRAYEVQDEYRLAEGLRIELHTYRRRGPDVPPELDPRIPLRFVALMRKAREPQNRVWLLQQFYEATGDFRLLGCLPEAVIGHSAQSIYPFLGGVGSLAEKVVEEATVDRLRARLAQLGAQAHTDVDRRALALLEFQMVLLAGRQAHGTERHGERALDALRRAFPGEWQEGEVALLAEFLADRGALQPEALAREQLRQLRLLCELAVEPSDRLAVAHHRARTLEGYGRIEEAVRILVAALDERRRAAGGRLPVSANDALLSLGRWQVQMQAFREAERVWLEELEADHRAGQRRWLRRQLFGLYRDAVRGRGELSLGKGRELYDAVVQRMRRDLARRADEQHAREVVDILCNLWQHADDLLGARVVGPDVTDFAFEGLPAVLELYQYRNGQPMVHRVSWCLEEVVGATKSLEFMVVRAETEPSWLRLRNEDFWSQHAWRIGDLIHSAEAGLSASLERRALAVVLKELRSDLRTRQQRHRCVYDRRNGYFWKKQRPAFVRTAVEILGEEDTSPRGLVHGAEYLFRGLGANDEAIDLLYGCYRRGLLHLEGRDDLATYLQLDQRWSESIPLVVELVGERPAEARYRGMLMRGHYHAGDPEACARALHQAEAWLREEGHWREEAIAILADACLDTALLEDCVRLYDEAIALHVRTAPRRGVGDGVLCAYYRQQSQAYAGLDRTRETVDAAAGAVVSWGHHIDQRRAELQNLRGVLERSRDLAAFVAGLDAETEATGLENPILRKALGHVFLEREQHAAAVAQLRLALQARPNDLETHELLMRAYDAWKRPDLAVEALLERSHVAGHELELYVELGRRLTDLEQWERAERAHTTLVELSPNESEGHRMLAQIRQGQDRWQDAVGHWRHVVRVRSEEPDGHLGLAKVLIQAKQADEARAVLEGVLSASWPARYPGTRDQARRLLEELGRRR